MNAHMLIALVALLAFPSCSLREATPDDQTFAEIVARVRSARWWMPPVWMACVGVGPFLAALGYATRFALYLASHSLAKGAAWLAGVTSMDGKDVRLYRTSKLRRISA